MAIFWVQYLEKLNVSEVTCLIVETGDHQGQSGGEPYKNSNNIKIEVQK